MYIKRWCSWYYFGRCCRCCCCTSMKWSGARQRLDPAEFPFIFLLLLFFPFTFFFFPRQITKNLINNQIKQQTKNGWRALDFLVFLPSLDFNLSKSLLNANQLYLLLAQSLDQLGQSRTIDGKFFSFFFFCSPIRFLIELNSRILAGCLITFFPIKIG